MPNVAVDNRLVYEVPEAGALLGLSRNAAYAAAKNGTLPTIRIGRLIRVPKEAIRKMLSDAMPTDRTTA